MVHFHRAAHLHWRRAALGHISLQRAFYFTSYLWVTSSHISRATIAILSWACFCTTVSIKPAGPFPLIFCFTPFSNDWDRQTYSYLLATLPPEIARLSEHGDQQEMVLRQGGCHNSAPAQPLWTETPTNYIFPWCYMSKAAEFVQHMDATASEHSLGSRNPCGYSTAPSMGRNAWLVLSGS